MYVCLERAGEGGIRENLAQDWFGRISWVRKVFIFY